jgi:hypothetical protein
MATATAKEREADRHQRILDQAAASGRSLIVMEPTALVALAKELGGGSAAGSTVLANSLAAQNEVIRAQADQIVRLTAQIEPYLTRIAELEKGSESAKVWLGRIDLAKQQLEADRERQKEMLGLLKIGGAAVATKMVPDFAGTLELLLGDLGGAAGMLVGGPGPGAARPAPRGAPGASAPTGREAEEPKASAGADGSLPGDLAGLVRLVVQRLSDATLDRILKVASRPSPNYPAGHPPPLVFSLRALIHGLDQETLRAVHEELGQGLALALIQAAQGAVASAGQQGEGAG